MRIGLQVVGTSPRYHGDIDRPSVLYHGSRVLVAVLEPINGAVNAAQDLISPAAAGP
jgi:hypothetical protein